MTAEVDWVLSQLGSVVGSTTVPLRRVNRDESHVLDGDYQSVSEELQQANYVSAAFVDEATSPIGTEYDHDIERVVGVRLEGLTHREYGYIDPDATNGIAFSELASRIRSAILTERTYPNAGPSEVTYTHLETANEAPQSDQHGDYYRYDFDVVFHGFETL